MICGVIIVFQFGRCMLIGQADDDYKFGDSGVVKRKSSKTGFLTFNNTANYRKFKKYLIFQQLTPENA